MNSPWMFIVGCMLLGLLAPEILVSAFKVKVPQLMNLISAAAFGLIAASFVI